jgi:hypothetical protein
MTAGQRSVDGGHFLADAGLAASSGVRRREEGLASARTESAGLCWIDTTSWRPRRDRPRGRGYAPGSLVALPSLQHEVHRAHRHPSTQLLVEGLCLALLLTAASPVAVEVAACVGDALVCPFLDQAHLVLYPHDVAPCALARNVPAHRSRRQS